MRKTAIWVTAAAVVAGGAATAIAARPTPKPTRVAVAWSAKAGPGFGGRHEAVSDASVAAKAIGITEAQLETALQGGQSIAAVAKAHGVDVQKVVDALVADANDELAAAVKAGSLTQAQADAEKADVTARVTAQVNGTGFGHGGFGPHGHDHDGSAPAPGTTTA